MHTSLFSRFKSTLIGLLLISAFISAQAATNTLGLWKAKNATSNLFIDSMAFGNNTYVMVGYNSSTCKNFIATSPDATTWTLKTTGSASTEFFSVIFSKDRFIAVCKGPPTGNARIWISDDNGNTWATRNSDNAGLIVNGGLHAVASDGNGRLIAAGGDPYGKGWLTVSNDNGTTWRVVRKDATTALTFPGEKFYGVGYALGKWYAFSMSGAYRSTDNGANWSSTGIFDVDDIGAKVASNQTTVVVASSTGPQWSNDGGITWVAGKPAKGFSGSLTSAASSVVYADGYFVLATRYAGEIWTSETGQTWKRWSLPTTTTTYALCYAKKSFWCAGDYGTLSKSPPWFKARLGCSTDYPYTLFDAEDGPPNRIGLPQYRVNTASLNLVLEATLFYTKTLGTPINMKLIYNSKPTPNGDSTIGLFGKNWRFRYESVVGRFGQDAQLVNGGGRSFSFSTPNGEDLDAVTADVILKAPDGIYDELKYVYNSGSPYFKLTLKSSHLIYLYETKGTTAGVNEGLFYLTGIQDQFGNTTTLTVNAANGQINTIKDPANRTFNFSYTARGCVAIFTPDGRTIGFTYDADKNLTAITDMKEYSASYEYDKDFTDKFGFITKMTTAGKATTFTYEDRPGYNEADTVENKGDKYVSEVTRPGGYGTITYELQDDGDTVKRTSPSGEVTLISNKEGQTTSIKDPLGNVRNIAFNDAKLPSSVADEKGGVYTYTYDDYGNILTQKDAMGKTTTYTYDTGNHSDLLTVTNALGKIWTYSGYANYQPGKVTTPLGYDTIFTYYSGGTGNGRLETITDPLNHQTKFTYDTNKCGNLTKVEYPAGGPFLLGYAGQGFRCTTMTDPLGLTKTIAWDNNDRLTTVTYTSAPGSPSYTNSYTGLPGAFGQTGFTDELGNTSTVVRDELGFITSITDPLGNVTQKEYDADSRPTKTIDPLGRATSTSYDNGGRPILFTDARGFKVVKEYDGVGNLVSFKDKNGAETKYTYDANSRLVTTTDPLKKITTITRNDIGKTATVKNARGQIITYTYDDDGRLTKKTSKPTATGVETTIFENTLLDANGNILTQKDPWGNSLTPATTTDYTYDKNNRVTKIKYPDGNIVELSYNNRGNIATITYPAIFGDKLVATYTYDSFNRQTIPTVLKNNPGTELAGESRSSNTITAIDITIAGVPVGSYALSYNNRGNIVTITRPNGIQTDYAYDNAGRITQIKHSSGGGVTDRLTANYVHDAVGNISSESFSGSEYNPTTQSLTSTALLYNATGELTKKGTKACVSDADGNLTDLEGGTMKCTYDAENRLTQYVRKVGTTTYTTKNTYNADGLRVKKAIDCGGGTTYYHYLPSGTLLFTTDLSGTIVDQHIYAGNMLLSTYNPSNTYDWGYYFCDRQGHVRFVADENGVSLAQYDYLPYGQYGANSDIKKFTYVGGLGVQDEGNGLFYMKNRFYDAGTGRFLQQDPIGFEGGSNLYAYADENPLRYVDPNGTASVGEWAWWGIVETAKVGVAAVAGTAAVVVGGVAVPVGIGIGAAVYVGEQAVHSMYQTGEKIKEMRKIAPSSSEASEEDQGNGNAAVAAQDKSGEQQEAIKKLGKSTEKETGSSGPTL